MASSNLMSNVPGPGLGGWNGLPQEVKVYRQTKIFCTLVCSSGIGYAFGSFSHVSSGFHLHVWIWLSASNFATLSSLHFT